MSEPTHETAQELAPPPERARTITDLARIAGVSPGTVSRALAGKSLVNAKTRERTAKNKAHTANLEAELAALKATNAAAASASDASDASDVA